LLFNKTLKSSLPPNAKRTTFTETLAAVLFTNLLETLRLCSSAEAEIVLNLFFNFEQTGALCSYKIVLIKSVIQRHFLKIKTLNLLRKCVFLKKLLQSEAGEPNPSLFFLCFTQNLFFQYMIKILLYSVDNRRLYVFRVLNILGKLDSIQVNKVNRFNWEKMTTVNGGCHLYVRNRRDNNFRWLTAETYRHCSCNNGRNPLPSKLHYRVDPNKSP